MTSGPVNLCYEDHHQHLSVDAVSPEVNISVLGGERITIDIGSPYNLANPPGEPVAKVWIDGEPCTNVTRPVVVLACEKALVRMC